MKYYILKKGDYYLSDIHTNCDFNTLNLEGFDVDKDLMKLYSDFELAEEDRKLIYIETGLAFEVKIFRKEEE